MPMIRTTTGARAYPTEPVEQLGNLTVQFVTVICKVLNDRAERLGLKTRYVITNR